MQLQFLGAVGTVTGSCYLLSTEHTKLLVDCGMYQGPKEIRERNYGKFIISPGDVDYVLLTHAHIDHSGLIPKFVKQGFKGKIFTVPPTLALCRVLLPDSAHIQEMEVERKNRKKKRANKDLIKPIYTVDDAYNCLGSFSTVEYDELLRLAPDIRVRFIDAGHILGSAMIEIWITEGDEEIKLVFSGDIGRKDHPLIKNPSIIKETDYLIVESTYGSRRHKADQDEKELLHDIIWETYNKGGNLIIPAFAVARTQDLLYHISQLDEENRMPPVDIYIDSPLSTAATGIFLDHRDYFDEEAGEMGEHVFLRGVRFTATVEESQSLNQVDRSIIISASGMCEAGRIRHHLKYNLWRPESTVLFVGYQAEGTLGRLIVEGEKTVQILGDEIAVRADIRSIEGYSAHADQRELLEWIREFRDPPREVFVTHGEPDASNTLAGLIQTDLGLNATLPVWRQTYNLTGAKAADPFRAAYESLFAKLRQAVDNGLLTAVQQEEVTRRMADLEAYINQI